MYIPESFKETDPKILNDFIAQYDFATLITCDEGVPYASHIPVVHAPAEDGPGLLRGHIAKANPQWQY
jgi:transcriptional regulator